MTPFDPRDFFRLGQRLANQGSNEADFRTAIGRGYYSCYLTARDALFGLDGRLLKKRVYKHLKAKGSHDAVIRGIANSSSVGPAKAKRLSDGLAELKDMRVQADYVCDPTHQGTTALQAKYGAANWAGLACAAMTLASNLLADLRKLARYP